LHGTLEDIVAGFSVEELSLCLSYLRDWNTNARNSIVAQQVLHHILRKFPPSVLQSLPDIKQLLEGLIPYTDRHLNRMDRLLQKSYILDYTLQAMQTVSDNGS